MAVNVSAAGRVGLVSGTVAAVKDVVDHYELLRMLVIKDLKIKYKASAVGLLWSLISPLMMMLIYTAIFGTIFKSSKPDFPVFILSGLLAWNFFGTALPAATVSVVGNNNLVRKTRFPTSLLPASVVLSNGINFLISLLLLFGLVLVYRHPLGITLVLLPVLIVAQVAFTLGIALLLSALDVFFRDVEHFLGIVLTVWFFATPILYPREAVVNRGNEAARLIIELNPMTWLVGAYRSIFYGETDRFGHFVNAWPNPRPLLSFIGLAALLLTLGFVVFVRLSRRFVEEV